MSKYELDDEVVRQFLGALHTSEDETPAGRVGSELRKQIPLPAPKKVGAVVRTDQPDYVWVRWSMDDSGQPWVDANDGEHRSTEGIGRIVEVLSEGVDL